MSQNSTPDPYAVPQPHTAHAAHALGLYDRATVGIWERSHAELLAGTTDADEEDDDAPVCLRQAAVHALLVRLRRCTDRRTIFDRYAADAGADFALIDSLIPPLPAPDAPDAQGVQKVEEVEVDRRNVVRRLRVQEAAFYLRWLELTARPGGGAAAVAGTADSPGSCSTSTG